MSLQRLSSPKPLILDGGTATHLERAYHKNLTGTALWSSSCLYQDPQAIRNVHLDYLRAGADIISTCSYQASVAGFKEFTQTKAKELMQSSVSLATEARDTFWDEYQKGEKENSPRRDIPLVALSLGPYGAILCNGAEYTGDYGDATFDDVLRFHKERLDIYAPMFDQVDFIAFETIPSLQEANIIRELLRNVPNCPPTWVSFSCRNSHLVSHGEPLTECINSCMDVPSVVAVGVNCTNPQYVEDLIGITRRQLDDMGLVEKWVVCYPDAGAAWDDVRREWILSTALPADAFGTLSEKWVNAVDKKRIIIGGCCNTTPNHIRNLRLQVFG
ncbi:8770_t:CDS:2 [Paraglomus occultum]|uniref:8770_t:CDS:1 n=1 Tax=Paraglomus occultum TaxID=144539 RepID=A0A9N9DA24_9GLOM|nr:8770_t:CDS:2 [Paraglomus occultum]